MKKELKIILANHKKWLANEENGIKADLRGADLSDAKDLWNSTKFFSENFKKTEKGYIVFKAIDKTIYDIPKHWIIEENSFITENVNQNPTNNYGCGVNFGTEDFIKSEFPNSDHWECLLHFEDMVQLIVPFNTKGNCRCERLQLIKKL